MQSEKERVSVVIIACNERERLPRLMETISFADEVILLDSGSNDGTIEWAKQQGCLVYSSPWEGYVKQKNKAMELATCSWILSVDCDEWLSEDLEEAIQQTLKKPLNDAYLVERCNHWIDSPMHYGIFGKDRAIRLFRKGSGVWEGIEPHDRYVSHGTVGVVQGVLHHQPYNSWTEHLEHIHQYSTLAAQDLYNKGKAVYIWDPLFRALWHLVRALVVSFGWLDGWRGIIVAFLGGYYTFLKWGKLLWKQQRSL